MTIQQYRVKVYAYDVKAIFNGLESPAVSLLTSDTHAKDFALGKVIQDASGKFQEITTAGKTGAVLPKFSTAFGATTNDGGVVWTVRATPTTRAGAMLKAGQLPVAPSNLLIVTRS